MERISVGTFWCTVLTRSVRICGAVVAFAACSSSPPSLAMRGAEAKQQTGAAGSPVLIVPPPAATTDPSSQSPNILQAAPAANTPAVMGSACASAELRVSRVVPTVWLMIDGSGSMAAPLDLTGPSRWSVLRDALMLESSGLVPRLQGSVAFGLYVYDGGLSLPGMAGPQCPRTVVVPAAVNNASAMSAMYPEAETGASTPTHYALLDLKMRIDAAGPNASGPTYIVLATDGKPNLCDFHDGVPATPETESQAVDTVRQLASSGTQVFVISMAGQDAELGTHLRAVAMAGGTGTSPFTPMNQDDLSQALTQIIGVTASCDVRIEGRVEMGRECTGTVTLNGVPLVCNDGDGYRLNDDRRSLQLTGAACSTLQTAENPVLKATFPCEDVVLL